MNSLAIHVSLCAIILAGLTSSVRISRSRYKRSSFDPNAVEHPLEEYKAAYQQHLQRQAGDSSKGNCTQDQWNECKPTWQEGWTLRKDNEADEPECQTVSGIGTESVFYSLPDNPCCVYHGCVVRDCEDLRKQWKYDGNQTCTEDDTPNGAEAVCKERVEAKFCGCSVKFCENKRCPTDVECPACYVKNGQVDQCGCQSQETSCDLEVFDPVCEPGNGTKSCVKCHRCVVDLQIDKDCQKAQGKTVARSHCVKEDCPSNPKCDPCQEIKMLPDYECKCPRWECVDRNLDPSTVCEVPPNDEGKCADECHELVDKPIVHKSDCNLTTKCCMPKEQATCAPVDQSACKDPCQERKTLSKCGCEVGVCQKLPILTTCEMDIDYTVVVETKSEIRNDDDDEFYGGLLRERDDEDEDNPELDNVKIVIEGSCTPEEKDDASKSKICEINLSGEKKGKNTCNNIGNVDKVKIVGTSELIKVTIKDVNNRNGTSTDIIINLKDDGDNEEWEKEAQVLSASAKKEITFSRSEEQKCEECETYTEIRTHKCSAMNGGQCIKDECPRPESNYNCAECDYPYLIPGRFFKCGCPRVVCTPTYETEAKCPNCTIAVYKESAPCKNKEYICIPDGERPECVNVTIVPPKNETTPKNGTTTPACVIMRERNGRNDRETCNECQKKETIEYETVIDDSPKICKKEECKPKDIMDCQTKEDKEKECDQCHVVAATNKTDKCGCPVWDCVKPDKDTVQGSCDKCDQECDECETVFSEVCGTREKSCKRRPCKQAGKCYSEETVAGDRKMNKCGCPIIVPNPCPVNKAQQCREDHKLVEGLDECDCETKVHVRCEKPDESQCNSACYDLKQTYSGCCKEYTCEKKACPKVEKPKCDPCEELTIEEDECGCQKYTCEKKACPEVEQPECDPCEELTAEDECGCTKYTCKRKTCPRVEKPKCRKCEELSVEDDDCGCCQPTCVDRRCPAIKRCGSGKVGVTIPDMCYCQILLRCDPEADYPPVHPRFPYVSVKTCDKDQDAPVPNTCKSLPKPIELCSGCK